MFEENDTKVSGTCGEVWNILADYLNFTYVFSESIKSTLKNVLVL